MTFIAGGPCTSLWRKRYLHLNTYGRHRHLEATGQYYCAEFFHCVHPAATDQRHLNPSWLWAQEKEASRELQYHKVKGSENGADLFTKALDHDSIVRHTEAMFGRDPIAFTVNNPSATVSMQKLALGAGEHFQDKWKNARVDTNGLTCTAELTRPRTKEDRLGGDVAYRVTADARNGDIINIEDATNINLDTEFRLVEGRPRDVVAVLLPKSVSGRDDDLGAQDNPRK